MDIFSHGAWAVAGGKLAEKKIGRPLRTWLLASWGVFPDLFAFAIPFIWVSVEILSGDVHVSQISKPGDTEPPVFLSSTKIFRLASALYDVSHSLFVFAGALFLAYIMLKKIPWEMFGWLLHVLMDVPTHPYNFFPTPLFWPLSEWKFTHGFSWGQPWFMAFDIAALLFVYGYLWRSKRLFRKKSQDRSGSSG